jgi:hypothetical protein
MGDMMTVWLNYGGVARAADGGQREEDENRRGSGLAASLKYELH